VVDDEGLNVYVAGVQLVPPPVALTMTVCVDVGIVPLTDTVAVELGNVSTGDPTIEVVNGVVLPSTVTVEVGTGEDPRPDHATPNEDVAVNGDPDVSVAEAEGTTIQEAGPVLVMITVAVLETGAGKLTVSVGVQVIVYKYVPGVPGFMTLENAVGSPMEVVEFQSDAG